MTPLLRAALSLLLVGACASPASARPALWRLAEADSTIYLFGTIHVLPPGQRWRDPAIDKALASSGALVLEAVLDTEPGEIARLLATIGRADGLPPLADRLPPTKRAGLSRLVARSGLPMTYLDGLKTWAAAVLLTGASLDEIGLKAGAEGVEPQVTRLFRAAHKPVTGLETAAQQFGFFDALPEAAQRTFLAATLDDPKRARADYDRMLAAWSKGDVVALARLFADEPDFTPALRDQLIRRRDEAWADALIRRLALPGSTFVAVGAGHLTGPDSVQAMLARKGYSVRRIQ